VKDTEATEVKEKDFPVNGVFENGKLIDAQTTVVPEVKNLEFVIEHKFGTIENGSSDMWGVYGSSNIRLGLNYVLKKNFQIGAGLTKKGMMGEKNITDLNAKWTLLKQSRKNTIPVSVALYGNVAINGASIGSLDTIREAFTGPVSKFKFSDRLSYFSEIIVSRKFCKEFSLQAGLSFTHYNSVLDVVNSQVAGGYDHDKLGAHVSGRIKVTPQGSIIFNYDQPLKIKQMSEQTILKNPSKPNVAIGYEVSTGTHAFQMYMGSTSSLLPQDNMMYNQNDWKNQGWSVGFVITRLWAF
jgi:hypothetical protein